MNEKAEGISRARSGEKNNQQDAGARGSDTATKHIKLGRATKSNKTKGGGINRALKGS